MTTTKPIIRAGTKLLMRKDGKLATSCCPQIYVFSRNGAYPAYPDGFDDVMCFDRHTLEVLWVQRPLYTYVVRNPDLPDEPLSSFTISEAKIYNNQILCGSYGINPESATKPQLTVFDLGLAQKFIIASAVSYNGGIGKVHDTFSTSDGKLFILTEYQPAEDNWGSLICCFDAEGVQIANIYEAGVRLKKITASLEFDGVFRVYAVGNRPFTNPDRSMDKVFCYSLVGTTFTKLWEYTDADSFDDETIMNGGGRGYELFVPQALESTQQQCYVVSMIRDKPIMNPPPPIYSDGTVTVRISVIEEGVLLWKWDILLNDPDIDEYVRWYCWDTFTDWPDWGTMEAIECALLYRNCNHFLYFRGSSTKYPNTLFRLNLTTGAAAEELTTLTWAAGEKPHLIGVPHSPATPYQFDTILMMGRTTLHLVDVDDLTVSLATNTIANAVESQRPGWSSYTDRFIAPRMNRELKFSS